MELTTFQQDHDATVAGAIPEAAPLPALPITIGAEQAIAHRGWTEAREAALAALLSGPCVVVIAGAPGTGKTLLLEELARALEEAGVAITLRQRGDLGQEEPATAPDAQAAFRVALIDEADRMDEAALARLAADPRSGLVLARKHVPADDEADLLTEAASGGRTVTVVQLAPLLPGETDAFLRARLVRSRHSAALIDNAAIAGIEAYSGGVPRLVNMLASAAFFLAASEDAARVTADHVAEAAALRGLSAVPDPEETAPADPPRLADEGEASPSSDAIDPDATAPSLASTEPETIVSPPQLLEPMSLVRVSFRPVSFEAASFETLSLETVSFEPQSSQLAVGTSTEIGPPPLIPLGADAGWTPIARSSATERPDAFSPPLAFQSTDRTPVLRRAAVIAFCALAASAAAGGWFAVHETESPVAGQSDQSADVSMAFALPRPTGARPVAPPEVAEAKPPASVAVPIPAVTAPPPAQSKLASAPAFVPPPPAAAPAPEPPVVASTAPPSFASSSFAAPSVLELPVPPPAPTATRWRSRARIAGAKPFRGGEPDGAHAPTYAANAPEGTLADVLRRYAPPPQRTPDRAAERESERSASVLGSFPGFAYAPPPPAPPQFASPHFAPPQLAPPQFAPPQFAPPQAEPLVQPAPQRYVGSYVMGPDGRRTFIMNP